MRILAAVALATMGCATTPSETFEDLLVGDEPIAAGKSDDPQACGNHGDVCEPGRCGAVFSAIDRNYVTTCAPENGSPAAFVHAEITGSVPTTIDTRLVPYVAAHAVDHEVTNARHYGCYALPQSTTLLAGPGDGISVQFAEYDRFSWAAGGTDTYHRLMFVTADRAGTAPGEWIGHGGYRQNTGSPLYGEGQTFGDSRSCSIKMTTDATGTVSGSFACKLAVEAGSAAVDVTGEFRCPMSTLRNAVWATWQRP